jgi:hypothetical protein
MTDLINLGDIVERNPNRLRKLATSLGNKMGKAAMTDDVVPRHLILYQCAGQP